MNSEKYLPTNPIKTRFAIRFLRALKKLNERRPIDAPARADSYYKRYNFIRAAAYTSMASAVGPKRVWSRAVLWKIRNRHSRHGQFVRRKRVLVRGGNPRKELGNCDIQENELRELVPGGESMDTSSLLYETADYIKCLRAQVQVMTSILDHFTR